MGVALVEMEWHLDLADLLDQLFYGLAWEEALRMKQNKSSKTGRKWLWWTEAEPLPYYSALRREYMAKTEFKKS